MRRGNSSSKDLTAEGQLPFFFAARAVRPAPVHAPVGISARPAPQNDTAALPQDLRERIALHGDFTAATERLAGAARAKGARAGAVIDASIAGFYQGRGVQRLAAARHVPQNEHWRRLGKAELRALGACREEARNEINALDASLRGLGEIAKDAAYEAGRRHRAAFRARYRAYPETMPLEAVPVPAEKQAKTPRGAGNNFNRRRT